ncbi:MAG: MFS transporter [Candidatus Thorarchaeota archaeon]|jgi:cyanate permease
MENEVLSKKDPYRWIILALLWLVYFAFGLILTSIPPLVNIIAADLSLSYSQMGVIIGSVIIMYIPLAVPIGVFIDRIGQKKMIAAGLLLISSSAALRTFVVSFETLFFAVLIFGLGGPTISVGLAKVTAASFEGKERGLASGIYMTGAIIGSATALAATNAIILPLVGTWRNVFVFYGGVGFVIALGWILLARESKDTSEEMTASLSLIEMVKSLLGHKQVWLVAIIGSAGFFTFYGFANWLPTLLEAKGMNPIDAGFWASLPSWLGLIGSIVLPGMAKPGSRKPVIILMYLIQGISILVTGLSFGAPLLVALIIYGLLSGANLPLLLVVMMDLPEVGAEYTGVASGLLFTIGASIGVVGPILVGYLTDITSSFLPAVVLLTIYVEIMILFALVMREK